MALKSILLLFIRILWIGCFHFRLLTSNNQTSSGVGSVAIFLGHMMIMTFYFMPGAWTGVPGPGWGYPDIPVFRALLGVTTVVFLIA